MYHQNNWKAGLRVRGAWSVTVKLKAGGEVHAEGEFCEIDFPRKLVMTRKFDGHPFQGTRETTISYRLEPSPHGTLVQRTISLVPQPRVQIPSAQQSGISKDVAGSPRLQSSTGTAL
jgi:uncharacterized protein YndB with AHSA1/START domain